jgi:hypothetical protein
MPSAADERDNLLTKLVLAILTFVKERDGFVTKTKLLKYLYLIDIEHYRAEGQLLTGFRWKFYKYGPWASEYDPFYSRLQRQGAIAVEPGTRPDLDTEFLEPKEEVELEDVFGNASERMRVRQILDTWAARPLGEMLDHVYFQTEPMEEAKRDEHLNFERINRYIGLHPAKAQVEKLPASSISHLRQRLKQAVAKRQLTSAPVTTPPRYDEVFDQGIATLERDTEY